MSDEAGPEVHIGGDDFQMTLRLLQWERPGLSTGSDANWIDGFVELDAGSKGTYVARQRLSLWTPDLRAFRDALKLILDSLSGEAVLEHLEAECGVKISLRSGVGELEAFVRENLGPRLSVSGVRTDQSYLSSTLRDLDAAMVIFGTRGDPNE